MFILSLKTMAVKTALFYRSEFPRTWNDFHWDMDDTVVLLLIPYI